MTVLYLVFVPPPNETITEKVKMIKIRGKKSQISLNLIISQNQNDTFHMGFQSP